MPDEEYYVSSEDHGFGSPLWMTRAALRAATRDGLLYGLDNMLTYMDTHARHVEDPDNEDCDGPDLWTAFDILVQTALTYQYIPTTDPEDIPEDYKRVRPSGFTAHEEESLLKDFRDALGLIPETTDPAPNDEGREGDD